MTIRKTAIIDVEKPEEVVAFYGWLSRNRACVLGISENCGCVCCVDQFSLELTDDAEPLPPACDVAQDFDSSVLKFGEEKHDIITNSIAYAYGNFVHPGGFNYGIRREILLESFESESDLQFCSALEGILRQTYEEIPQWLRFCVGCELVHGGRYYRPLTCLSEEIAFDLMHRSFEKGGFERAIVFQADHEQKGRAYEIRAGVQTEVSLQEFSGR